MDFAGIASCDDTAGGGGNSKSVRCKSGVLQTIDAAETEMSQNPVKEPEVHPSKCFRHYNLPGSTGENVMLQR